MIQSVDRGARILEALSAGSHRLGVTDLAAQLGLPKGTVHGLLRTLLEHRLVEQDPESDKYQLGAAVVAMSGSYLQLSPLRVRALAWSEFLASRSNHAVRLGTPHRGGVLVVHHVLPPEITLPVLEIGAVLPYHATALGKALLAFSSAVNLPQVLQRFTGHTVIDHRAIEGELTAIRARGYATEQEEAILGECSIAAPVFDGNGDVAGAIGITGSLELFEGTDRATENAKLVTESARAVSREMGANQWATPFLPRTK